MRTTRMVIIAAAVAALAAPIAVQAAPKNGSGGGKTTTTTSTLDIATAISDTLDPVKVGDKFTYRTVVSNVGTATASGLQVFVFVRHADARGTALFSSVTTTQGSCTMMSYGPGSQVPFHGASDVWLWPYERSSLPVCTIGTLAPGSTATVDVVVSSTYPSKSSDPSRYYPPLTARTSHSLEGSDADYTNDRDTEGTTVTTGDPVLDCMLTTPTFFGPFGPCVGLG